jgi:hypothetical protein
MITLGTTLRCNLPPRHIWIVITDPARTKGDILLANLTTLTDDSVDDRNQGVSRAGCPER